MPRENDPNQDQTPAHETGGVFSARHHVGKRTPIHFPGRWAPDFYTTAKGYKDLDERQKCSTARYAQNAYNPFPYDPSMASVDPPLNKQGRLDGNRSENWHSFGKFADLDPGITPEWCEKFRVSPEEMYALRNEARDIRAKKMRTSKPIGSTSHRQQDNPSNRQWMLGTPMANVVLQYKRSEAMKYDGARTERQK